ncbi:MAG: hypothetical protein ACOCX5_02320 [Chloroflexota bacterium]
MERSCPELVRRGAAGDEAARMALLVEDEAVVEPLIDCFYAGVSEDEGLFILELLALIGGYEARQLFEDQVQYGVRFESWEVAARAALDDML